MYSIPDKMHGNLLFYCALISVLVLIISADSCTIPTFPRTLDSSASFSIRGFVQDINDFNNNSDQRIMELLEFIEENQYRADELNIKYYLYTPKNPDVNYTLKPTVESLSGSNFDPFRPTAFIIHGYIQVLRVPGSPIAVTKDKLIERYNYNVIFVDYTNLTQVVYSETVKNSYLLARKTAHFVQFLVENTITTAEQIHLIGISLGGQIAGNTGYLIPGLGRISALDPAGPIFTKLPHAYRLSYHDANFVDIIHTGDLPFPKGLGFIEPQGHQDFYPNGGLSQPGCVDTENGSGDPVQDVINSVCDHERAMHLFLASICVDCHFTGVKCDSYECFENGSCPLINSVVAPMGIDARKNIFLPPNTKFYLDTSDHFPFCTQSK